MINKLNKVLIATGGTGGHVFPAYGLAKHFEEKTPLKKQNENLRIASLNTQGGKLEACAKYMETAN